MFQGVLRDDARLAAKRVQKAREVEFEEQARKRAYLENMQGVSTGNSPKYEGEIPKTAEGMNFGCTDCLEKSV